MNLEQIYWQKYTLWKAVLLLGCWLKVYQKTALNEKVVQLMRFVLKFSAEKCKAPEINVLILHDTYSLYDVLYIKVPSCQLWQVTETIYSICVL